MKQTVPSTAVETAPPARPRALLASVAALALLASACGGEDAAVVEAAAEEVTTDATDADGGSPLADLVPEAIREAGVLENVIQSPNPPMEFSEPGSDEFEGFDIDLANAIGDLFGVEVDFTNVEFEQLIPSVQTGRADMSISATLDLPERQEQISFVDYFNIGNAFFTSTELAEDFQSIEDLCGMTIAVDGSTNYPVEVREVSADVCEGGGLEPIEVLEVASSTVDAPLQIQQGRAQGAYTAITSIGFIQSRDADTWAMVGEPFARGVYGIKVNKDDEELQQALQAALQELIDNGTYMELLEKWELTDGAVDEAVINGAT